MHNLIQPQIMKTVIKSLDWFLRDRRLCSVIGNCHLSVLTNSTQIVPLYAEKNVI